MVAYPCSIAMVVISVVIRPDHLRGSARGSVIGGGTEPRESGPRLRGRVHCKTVPRGPKGSEPQACLGEWGERRACRLRRQPFCDMGDSHLVSTCFLMPLLFGVDLPCQHGEGGTSMEFGAALDALESGLYIRGVGVMSLLMQFCRAVA